MAWHNASKARQALWFMSINYGLYLRHEDFEAMFANGNPHFFLTPIYLRTIISHARLLLKEEDGRIVTKHSRSQAHPEGWVAYQYVPVIEKS